MNWKLLASGCAFWASVAFAAEAQIAGEGAMAGLQAAALDAKGLVVNGKTVCKTERRDFADGWAVRYVLPEDERRVEREETVWTLPLDAKVWYQKYGMDYEKPYRSSLVRDIPAGTVMRFARVSPL